MKEKLGATGNFPKGKLNQDDGGELRTALYIKDNRLIIDYGKLVAWVGLDKKAALQYAQAIIAITDNLVDDNG